MKSQRDDRIATQFGDHPLTIVHLHDQADSLLQDGLLRIFHGITSFIRRQMTRSKQLNQNARSHSVDIKGPTLSNQPRTDRA